MKRLTLAAVFFLAPVSALRPEEWVIVGPRAMGMGGAGVALTRGGLSSYWNPAGLAPPSLQRSPTFWDVEVPVGASAYAAKDFFREVDDVAEILDDLDLDAIENILDDPGLNLDAQQIQSLTRLIVEELPDLNRPGSGLVSQASAGVMARVWQIGFSALGIAHAGGLARVDLTNVSLGDEGLTGAIGAGADRTGQLSPAGQAFADQLAGAGLATQNQAEELVFQSEQAGVDVSDPTIQGRITDLLDATADNAGGGAGNSFSNNNTGADFRGILLQEYALSFAQPFFSVLSVGVNAKLMNGMTYFKSYTLRELDDVKGFKDDLFDRENREESLAFGVDAGLLLQPTPWLSLGAVGRNLNNPEFDFKGPGDFEIERQFRAGVGIEPFANTSSFFSLGLAADIDIVKNKSESLPGYESQILGGGAEIGLGDVLFLRAGVSKNLRESAEDLLVHAGLGLRLWVFNLDAAATLSPDLTEITTGVDDDPTKVPERAGLSIQLGLNIPLD